MMRVVRLSLIAALLCATGAQWVLLQTVAWAKMSLDAMRTKVVVAAVVAATDGQHSCAMCRAARSGAAESQKRLPARSSNLRLHFVSTTPVVFVRAPVSSWIVEEIRVGTAAAFTVVELPPPCRLPA